MEKPIIRHHFPEIDSTNDWLKRHIDTIDDEHMVIVTADGQSKGRGRHGKSWLSPYGLNLYITFGWRPDPALSLWQLRAARAVAYMLQELGLAPTIKYPNDVLVGGKKIAGILTEVIQAGDHELVIVGIGLNVAMDDDLLSTIDQPATSLKKELSHCPSVEQAADHLIDAFFQTIDLNDDALQEME